MRPLRITATALFAIALVVAAPFGAQAAQLNAAAPVSEATVLSTRLSGLHEVPPADPDGLGFAVISVLDSGTDRVCITLVVARVAQPATGLHIHFAPVGSNGPIVVAFTPNPTTSAYSKCVVVANQTLIDNLQANPSQYYLNFHNLTYPGGAIRGQLVALPGQ